MKYRLRKFPLLQNSLTATLFHSFVVWKSVFYSKNIQYAYNIYGTELYLDGCRGVFRTQQNICGWASLQKSQENFAVDFRLASKYVSGIGFTVERFTENQYLSDMVKVDFENLSKICHCLFVYRINKKYVGLILSWRRSLP